MAQSAARPRLTCVIPVYNERETLEPLVDRILENVPDRACRIILVDDGSTDGSWDVMVRLHARTPAVSVVRLRRNYGKAAALAAGFHYAPDGWVVTLDADLQDEPAEIPRFIAKLQEGCDLVVGWKKVRHDPWHKTIPSHIYNAVVCRLFGLQLHDINCGFKAFRHEVLGHLPLYGGMHRLIPVFAARAGFRVAEIPVRHHRRRFGVSKYGFSRFIRGTADVLTVYALGHGGAGRGLRAVAGASAGLGAAGLLAALVWSRTRGPRTAAGILAAAGGVLLAGGLVLARLGCLARRAARESTGSDPSRYIQEIRVHAGG